MNKTLLTDCQVRRGVYYTKVGDELFGKVMHSFVLFLNCDSHGSLPLRFVET
ncbi:MAG: hypothetical protein P8N76_11210 [Pirellulaceae bacterium]|nr:hypothetical protein [Pirellulaceae bacterium]